MYSFNTNSSGLTHPSQLLRIREELDDLDGYVLGAATLDELAGFTGGYHFLECPTVCYHTGQLMNHRFQRGDTEGLKERRHHEQ